MQFISCRIINNSLRGNVVFTDEASLENQGQVCLRNLPYCSVGIPDWLQLVIISGSAERTGAASSLVVISVDRTLLKDRSRT